MNDVTDREFEELRSSVARIDHEIGDRYVGLRALLDRVEALEAANGRLIAALAAKSSSNGTAAFGELAAALMASPEPVGAGRNRRG